MRPSSRAPRIDVLIEDEAWRSEATARRLIRRAAVIALAARPRRGRRRRHPEATILLASDSRLRGLNRLFRGRNKITNVLSFPGGADSGPYLGDIALGHGRIAKEAAAQGKPFAAHAAHLALHGILHLLGYDHDDEAEAEIMEGLEIILLQQLGVPNPYAPGGCTHAAKAA